MKNRCQNRSFLMAQNHIWRYTLRLFHTFAFFQKSRKIGARRESKSHAFWSKNGALAPKDRFIQPFWSICGGSKNPWIFDITWWCLKIIKNQPVRRLRGAKWRSALERRYQFSAQVPPGRAPRAHYTDIKYRIIKYRIIKYRILKNGNEKHVSGSNTPMGRWPGEFEG